MCVASSFQMDANVSSLMASWVDNMIISTTSYNVGTCSHNVDNNSLYALGINIKSIFCEVGLSLPLCKGGPVALIVC
jgi:hypothetical protein